MPDAKILLAFLLALIVTSLGSCQYGKHLQKQADDLDVQTNVNTELQKQNDRLVALQDQLGDALDENAKLRQKHAADAAAARAAVTGLRQQLDGYRSGLRAQPESPGNQYAATIADLLGQCSIEYQQLAEQADGHAADVKLLQAAWPK